MLPDPISRREFWENRLGLMRRELDNIAHWLWGDDVSETELTGVYPVDMYEDEGFIIVEAELPGFKKDEIDVTLSKGMVEISAQREPGETKGKKQVSERKTLKVKRSLRLPSEVDESNIKATLEDGVLTLKIPKKEEKEGRKIEIK